MKTPDTAYRILWYTPNLNHGSRFALCAWAFQEGKAYYAEAKVFPGVPLISKAAVHLMMDVLNDAPSVGDHVRCVEDLEEYVLFRYGQHFSLSPAYHMPPQENPEEGVLQFLKWMLPCWNET